jgi:hypothetical protein
MMAHRRMTKFAVLLSLLAATTAINNGVGWLPPMGWSTWNTFRFNISSQLIRQVSSLLCAACVFAHCVRQSAEFMARSPLKAAGYEVREGSSFFCSMHTRYLPSGWLRVLLGGLAWRLAALPT